MEAEPRDQQRKILLPPTLFRAPDQTKDVLIEVRRHRYISNKQLFQLASLIPSDLPSNLRESRERSITRITSRLAARGILTRHKVEVEESKPKEFIYFVTDHGYNVLQRKCGIVNAHDYYNSDKRPDGLYHDWDLTNVHMAFDKVWQVQHPGKRIYWEQRQTVLHDRRLSIKEPDADAFTYVGRSYSYIEREHRRQGRFRNSESDQSRKVSMYEWYASDGDCEAKWKTHGLTVTRWYVRWIFDNMILAENFCRRVARKSPNLRHWATSSDTLKSDPAGKIWFAPYDVHGGVQHSLLE